MISGAEIAVCDLVEGAHYWAKFPDREWGVWHFKGGLMLSDMGGGYRPDQFDHIVARVFTPEDVDAQDRALMRLRSTLSAISVEVAYSAETLAEAEEAIANVARLANAALDGAGAASGGVS